MNSTSPARRWGRRGLLLANVAAAVGLGFALRGDAPQKIRLIERTNIPARVRVEQAPRREMPTHSIPIPGNPLHFSEIPKGNYCSMYARLSAERLFDFHYKPGDAWELARQNKSVWRARENNDPSFLGVLRPGQIVGIYNPQSHYNSPDHAYTHVGIVVGFRGKNPIIMHRVGTKDILQDLDSLYREHKGWQIREVIEPRK